MKDIVHLGWKWPSQIKNRGLSGRWWRRRRPGGSSACRWWGSAGRSTWAGRWRRELIWGGQDEEVFTGGGLSTTVWLSGEESSVTGRRRGRWCLLTGRRATRCWGGAGGIDRDGGEWPEELSSMRCPQQRGNRRWGVSQGPSMAQLWRRTRAPMSAVGGEKASWEIVQRW
jgi:hypothetical protein